MHSDVGPSGMVATGTVETDNSAVVAPPAYSGSISIAEPAPAREYPKPDYSQLDYTAFELPYLMAFGAVPYVAKEYEQVEGRYWAEKSKSFLFEVEGDPEDLAREYAKSVTADGWTLTENHPVAVAPAAVPASSAVQSYFVERTGTKYSVSLSVAYSGSSRIEGITRVSISSMPDSNILYRIQPVPSEVAFPPFPFVRAVWKGMPNYRTDGDAYSLNAESYYFTLSGSVESAVAALRDGLQKSSWNATERSMVAANAVFTGSPILSEKLANLDISRDTKRFSLSISDRRPHSTGALLGRVSLHLVPNLVSYKEGVDYFALTGSAFEEIPSIAAAAPLYVSFATVRARKNLGYTYGMEKYLSLPEPAVFASNALSGALLTSLRSDLEKSGYRLSASTDSLDGRTSFQAVRSASGMSLDVVIRQPIPAEFAEMFAGKTTLVELAPSVSVR